MKNKMGWLYEDHSDKRPKCPEAYNDISEYVILGAKPTMSIKKFLITFREMFNYSKNLEYDKAYELRTFLMNEGFKTDYRNLPDYNKDLLELEKKYL